MSTKDSINPPKKFLFLENSYMSKYTLGDVERLDNVRIFHWKSVSHNKLVNLLFNLHHSGKIANYVKLPFKTVWHKYLFGDLLQTFTPEYIIFTSSWYSDDLIRYFRSHHKNCKLILRFSDKVSNSYGEKSSEKIKVAKNKFDGIIVYNHEDALEFDCVYHSVGYSKVDSASLKPCKHYDVVFIGAAKGRMAKIREAYMKFKNAGLSCFFYVILAPKSEIQDDGIIYSDKVMPFLEYLSYEVNAKCLFELVQEGTTGRTYRLMESVIYNKLLITNCTEIKETPYYNQEYVQLFNDVSDIDPVFVNKRRGVIDFKYKGDFSPKSFMNFIENTWR